MEEQIKELTLLLLYLNSWVEKVRMDMYDAVMQENLWRDFMGDEVTEFIDYDLPKKLKKRIDNFIIH